MESNFRSFRPLFHMSEHLKCVFIHLRVNVYTMEPDLFLTIAAVAWANQQSFVISVFLKLSQVCSLLLNWTYSRNG